MTETIFITGADKGLGFSLAEKFLSEGYHVFAGQYITRERLQLLVERFPQTLTIVPLDVSDEASVSQAARTVAGLTDALDVLINNAAVYLEGARPVLEDDTGAHWLRTLDVNALGPLRVTRRFLPLLERGRRKLIVNISSEAGSIADCWRDREYAYCMSKAALNMQSRILHNYLTPRGFTVLAVHPGWMRTDMGGPDADLDPAESAAGIFALVTRDWSPDDPIYVDYQGRPMRW
ncbi:MAG: SDR family oxidoreductase [Anaerolineae bacterium]|nr:SDR family oxidoreductase [Anaerolineae bacterium]